MKRGKGQNSGDSPTPPGEASTLSTGDVFDATTRPPDGTPPVEPPPPDPSDNDPEPEWPEFFGPYRRVMNAEPRRGGMGIVFKAEKPAPRSGFVALKTVRKDFHNPRCHELFSREINTSDAAEHPFIVRVHDHGRIQLGAMSLPFLVLDWLEDPWPLDDPRLHARLTLLERVELAVMICDAVEAAHLKGIIHTDLKPGNVVVIRTETAAKDAADRLRAGGFEPRIFDFGVARRLQPWASGDRPWAGTPRYMPPEVRFDRKDPDARADIYALGVMFYQFLSGHEPPDLVEGVQPPPPPGLDPALASIVSKAMAYRWNDRYASAAALRGELERVASRLRTRTSRRRFARWVSPARRWRALHAASPWAARASLVVGVAVLSYWLCTEVLFVFTNTSAYLAKILCLAPLSDRPIENVRIVAIDDTRLPEQYAAAGIDESANGALRSLIAEVVRKVTLVRPRVLAPDIFFLGENTLPDQDFADAVHQAANAGIPVILAVDSWSTNPFTTLSRTAYSTAPWAPSTIAAGDFAPLMYFCVQRGNSDPVPSIVPVVAGAFRHPGMELDLSFNGDRTSVLERYRDPAKPNGLDSFDRDQRSWTTELVDKTVDAARLHVESGDYVTLVPIKPRRLVRIKEIELDALDVLTKPVAELSDLRDRIVLITVPGKDEEVRIKGVGRPAAYLQAQSIDDLVAGRIVQVAGLPWRAGATLFASALGLAAYLLIVAPVRARDVAGRGRKAAQAVLAFTAAVAIATAAVSAICVILYATRDFDLHPAVPIVTAALAVFSGKFLQTTHPVEQQTS